MGRKRRRIAAVAMGALLASPALALLTGLPANADLASIGPITVDGYTDALTYDTATGAFDNFLKGSVDSYPYQLDVYYDPAGAGNGEVLLTIPLLFQGGFTDAGGTITPVSSVNAADFGYPDAGLLDLGGSANPAVGVVSFGPFDSGGSVDYVSINSDTFAVDNYLTGAAGAVPFDLDFFTGASGSDTSEILLTIPSLLQVGLDDVGGVITPIFSLGQVIAPDVGLASIAGL